MFGRLLPFQAAQSLLGRFQKTSNAQLPLEVTSRREQPATSIICVLPEDVFYLIFAMLDVEDLSRCSSVCLILAHLVQNDMHAQYRIELSLAGMTDGMRGDMPLSEKITKLKEHRIRSRSCPRPLTSDVWPSTDQHIQVLVCDGSLVYCSRGAESHRVDIRPADGSLPRRLDIPLPGVTHIEAVDLAQELLIVSERTLGSQEIRLHLLSAKSGELHPDVTGPVPSLVGEPFFPQVRQIQPLAMQIYGQYIAWKTRQLGTTSVEVEIWDWKAGARIWKHTFGKHVSFLFLDDSHLLVTAHLQEKLEVYHFNAPHLVPDPQVNADPLLILELPLGAFRCWVHQDDRYRVHSSRPDPRLPFHLDPMLAITAIRFSIYTPELSAAVLLVPGATFRNHIDAAHAFANGDPSADLPDGADPKRVFWHEWGPNGSLLLNVSGSAAPGEQIRPAFGSPLGTRFPLLIPDRRDKTTARVVIFDLGQRAVREAQLQGGGGAGGDRLAPLKDLNEFYVKSPRSSIPHVAYSGPRLTFPEGHKPTVIAMTQTGFTVLHEWSPPYQEKAGVGYQMLSTQHVL